MRAPFSDLAKQVLSSPSSAAQLRRFLGEDTKNTSIVITDEHGRQKTVRVEKLDDIATTKPV